MEYFDSLAAKLKEDGKPTEIKAYKALWEFEAVMRPYEQARARKQAARQERRLDPKAKAKLDAETTVIYDGKEGKIVMPHTKFACRYWGNETKWCIAAEKDSENMFEHYNKKNPVIIYLPKPEAEDFENFGDKYSSFKFAAVDKLYDEEDSSNPYALPECLKSLAKAAGDNLPLAQRDWFARYGQFKKIVSDDLNSGLAALPRDWEDEIERSGYVGFYPSSQELWQNRDFVLAAVQQHGFVLQWADPALKKDREILMAALRQNIWGVDYEAYYGDREVALVVVQQNFYRLKYFDLTIKKDHEVALVATRQHSGASIFAGEILRNKIRFIQKSSPAFRFSLATGGIAQEVMKLGFGLSPNLVPKALLKDRSHIMEALKAAKENGNEVEVLQDLRHIKNFWGDFDALTSVDGAIAKLQKDRVKTPRPSRAPALKA